MQLVGICLFLLGIAYFVFHLLGTHKSNSVTADRGGVAIGRDSHGNINTGTIGSNNAPQNSRGLRIFDIIAGLCSIVGLILTVWDLITK